MISRYQKARRSSLTLYVRPVTSTPNIRGIIHTASLQPMPILDPTPPPPDHAARPQSKPPRACDLAIPEADDDGVPQTIQLVCSSGRHSDAPRLEILPPLSRTVDNAFLELFERKMKICTTKCDFGSPNADIENKSIKQTTLTEILGIYSEPRFAKQLPIEAHMQVLEMCKTNIFRQLPTVDPVVLSSEILPTFQDPAMQHIMFCYKIIQKLIAVTDKNSIVKMNLGKQFLKQFNSPDIDERDALANILYLMAQAKPKRTTEIITSVGVMLTEYREGILPPFCVFPCLTFLIRILNSTAQSIPQVFFDVCRKNVLELLSTRHLVSFFPSFHKLMVTLAALHTHMASATMERAARLWPSTSPSKQECVINLITDVIPHLGREYFLKHVKMIFYVYQNCAFSTAKVVDASLRVWQETDIRPRIMERTKVIFPIIFDAYLTISKSHWCPGIQTKVLSVLKTMQCLDSTTYEDLMARANGLLPANPEENKTQRNWAVIARAAARADRSVNVSQVLGEIQMQFNGGNSLLSIHSVQSGVTRSTAKLFIPSSASVPVWR